MWRHHGLGLVELVCSRRRIVVATFFPMNLKTGLLFLIASNSYANKRLQISNQKIFSPLPCAHPNCQILALAYRHEGKLVPLTRFIDAKSNLDLLANGLSFTREEGKRLVQQYLSRQSCCGPGWVHGRRVFDPIPFFDTKSSQPTGSSEASRRVLRTSSCEAARGRTTLSNHYYLLFGRVQL